MASEPRTIWFIESIALHRDEEPEIEWDHPCFTQSGVDRDCEQYNRDDVNFAYWAVKFKEVTE